MGDEQRGVVGPRLDERDIRGPRWLHEHVRRAKAPSMPLIGKFRLLRVVPALDHGWNTVLLRGAAPLELGAFAADGKIPVVDCVVLAIAQGVE